MKCPFCGAPRQEVRVAITEYTDAQCRRRRECKLCTQRWSTVEVIVPDGARTKAQGGPALTPTKT